MALSQKQVLDLLEEVATTHSHRFQTDEDIRFVQDCIRRPYLLSEEDIRRLQRIKETFKAL